MSGSGARRGGGFLAGALTGLAVSALALAAWSLNAPLAPRSPASTATAAADPAPPASATAQDSPLQAAAPAAPASPSAATSAKTSAGKPPVEPRAEPAPADAEPAHPLEAEPVAAPPASKSQTETEAQSAPAADARAPDPALVASPKPAAPLAPRSEAPEPASKRNAEGFDAQGAARVAVALTGVDAARLARALALGAPLTLVIDPAAPDAGALVARARAAGCEVVTLGADADPRAVGVAADRFDADALARARGEGLLTLALAPGARTPPPDGAAAFALDGDASAARVFQTLQEAARRAAPGAGVVVALDASEAALTALARWLAVTDAAPAPFSAVAVSAGR